MPTIELSHVLNEHIQPYPGEPGFSHKVTAACASEGYNVRALSLTSHTGTHIDAPFHFFPDGRTIDQIPLEQLIGPLLLIDLSTKSLQPRARISWVDVEALATSMKPGAIVLFNTGWSRRYWRTPKNYAHPYLTRDVAEGLWMAGVRVVGIDTMSPDETAFEGVGGEEGFGFHEVFLGRGGVIAENLTNLESLIGLESATVHVIPLNIEGSDGSPVRAFVTTQDS